MARRTLQRIPVGFLVTLTIALLTAPAPAFSKNGGSGSGELRFFLLSTGADPNASAEVKLKDGKKDRFEVKLRQLPVGSYDVLIAGVDIGSVGVKPDESGGTSGKLKIKSGKGASLPFDPLGMPIEVAQSGTVFFSDLFPTSSSDLTAADFEVDLNNTGIIFGAEGEAGFKLIKGKMEFDVEIEDVPAGDYELRVGGVTVATITAALRAGKNSVEGEVEFSTSADGKNDVPLTFDPRGKLVEVLQGSAVILMVDFPAAAPGL